MPNKIKFETIFSKDQLPPLFGDLKGTIGIEWRKLSEINFESIGRILTCHLIVEHYLTNYLSILGPNDLDWDSARLSFANKIVLAQKRPELKECNLIDGIKALNKVRNSISHNLQAIVNENDIRTIKNIVVSLSEKLGFSKEDAQVFDRADYSDVAAIEFFTSLTCAFIAVFWEAVVQGRKLG